MESSPVGGGDRRADRVLVPELLLGGGNMVDVTRQQITDYASLLSARSAGRDAGKS